MTGLAYEAVDACPMCGARAYEPRLWAEPVGVVRCRRCRLVRATATAGPQILDAEERRVVGSAEPTPDSERLARHTRHALAGFDRLAAGWILGGPRGRRVLHVGCNTGALLHELRAVGWQTFGIEQRPSTARMAANEHELLEVDIEDDAVDFGHRFDLITMTQVLDRVRRPVAVLESVARHLTYDGVLVVEVPNWNDWARALWGRWYWPLERGDWVSMLTSETLEETLSRAGLVASVIDATPQGATTILPSALAITRIVRARFRRAPSRRSASERACSTTGATRAPTWLRTASIAALDMLDRPLRRLTPPDADWGANLTAVARTNAHRVSQ